VTLAGQLIVALAVALAVTAAVFDVRERRIPNRLTYPAMIIGPVVQGLFFGWKGLLVSLAGGLIFGGFFLLFYLVRAMGAGDVKLAAAIGFMVGLPAGLQVMFATALSGGLFAIIQMLRGGRFFATLRSTASVAQHHVRRGLESHPEVNLDNPKALRLPYGLAFATGTLYWAAISVLGR